MIREIVIAKMLLAANRIPDHRNLQPL